MPLTWEELESKVEEVGNLAMMAFLSICDPWFDYIEDQRKTCQHRISLGMTLMEASRFAGISHALICGGNGRCPTCCTKILLGNEQQTQPMRRRSYKE